MKVSVDTNNATDYKVIDKKTGKMLRGVQWADDERGVFEQLELDKEGMMETCPQCKRPYTKIVEKEIEVVDIRRK